MITKDTFNQRLQIATGSFETVTAELVKLAVKKACKDRGIPFENVRYGVRKVLCNKVGYVTVFNLDTHSKVLFKLTVNEELYNKWRGAFDSGYTGQRIYCRKEFYTFGKDVLSYLSDSEYLTELHKIEKEVLIHLGYNPLSFIFDIKSKKGFYQNKLQWDNFDKLVKWSLKEVNLF